MHPFIYSCISVRIHLPTWNGVRDPRTKKFLIRRRWIAGSGAGSQKQPVPRESLSRPNTMTDFVYGPVPIQNIPWHKANGRNGKGDVLKELSEACREAGFSFGVYLSPWDRNHPAYGTAAYNDVFVNMMKEVVNHYGPFFEFWWDGANGEGPNGKKQVYDWHRFESTMTRRLHPIRWSLVISVPISAGWAMKTVSPESTNWNLLDTAGFRRGLGAPPNDTLNQGNVNGKNWIPAECDVSIRPGWFYHPGEDSLVKSPQKLFDIYLKSIGRGRQSDFKCSTGPAEDLFLLLIQRH